MTDRQYYGPGHRFQPLRRNLAKRRRLVSPRRGSGPAVPAWSPRAQVERRPMRRLRQPLQIDEIFALEHTMDHYSG